MYDTIAEIDGRMYYVRLPDHENDPTKGMILSPPDLSSLNLPAEVEERLHVEMFVRGIKDRKIATKKRQEVFAALQAAFAVSVDKILECY
jgi:hypothetical protein